MQRQYGHCSTHALFGWYYIMSCVCVCGAIQGFRKIGHAQIDTKFRYSLKAISPYLHPFQSKVVAKPAVTYMV
jgi:hypothetical protein